MIDARQHTIGKLSGYDSEEVTVAATAIGLTAVKLATATKPKEVFIQCESAQVRYYYDGTTPTASSGFVLNPFDSVRIKGTSNLTNLLFIRTGASSAKLTCCYER